MTNTTIFCLTLNPNHEEKIKRLSYKPVGLGESKFSSNFLTDKQGFNISEKNPFYGEYTFHYWLWKNYLDEIKTPWIGFCQYRKFFFKNELIKDEIKFNDLEQSTIKHVNVNENNFDCILGKKFSTENIKLSKILKHHLFYFLSNPNLFFNKKKRNIKFHFDLMHGEGNLEKAISLLDDKYKKDFEEYVNTEVSFNPHNMFICNSKEILNNFYSVVFPWLERCENKFGFNLEGYGLRRIYGFLAERFMPFWFKKNTRCKTLPIIFKDISEID